MGMNVEIPVFIETNLGTRIAIPISEDITASSLQREIERAHMDIFPELGFLSIHALTVKRNSKFYRLPESFPVKYAFEGLQTIWLLHADVSRPKSLEKTSLLGKTVSKRKGTSIHVHNGKEVNRKKRRKERCLHGTIPEVSFPDRVDPKSLSLQSPDKKGYNSNNNKQKISEPCVIGETPCESNSGVISVSGIIDRYFRGIVEIGEVGSAFSSEACMKFGQNPAEGQVKKTPSMKTMLCCPLPPELSSVSLRRYERSEVGKRLVTASGSLSRCQNSRGSSLLKDKRLQGPDDCSIVRNLVFEIDDND